MAVPRRTIPLANGWKYRKGDENQESSSQLWSDALPVPTNIHLDLLTNSSIPDPFLERNEEQVQWIGETAWTYATTFTIPEDIRNQHGITGAVVFEGLDTYATVRLNGTTVLKSDNMFVVYRVDLSEEILRSRESHNLEITFAVAETKGDVEVAKYPEHNWKTFNSGVARLATRKEQYHYGWDWGPKLMTCGPWRPVYLEFFQSRITELVVQSTLDADLQSAELSVALDVEGPASHATIVVEHQGTIIDTFGVSIEGRTACTQVNITNPHLWWVHTLGEQKMYTVTAHLANSEVTKSNSLDVARKRVGIRKVELVRVPFSKQDGESFFFKVNGVPIFGAGSNWIPGDLFQPRLTSGQLRGWVAMAKESNQVMIRVWGGSVYEHQVFYDACDEMGVLVWQDFMFACGLFPAYPKMLKRIRLEADQNVRRLRHHPSLALWCGNNEDYIITILSRESYDADEKNPEAILQSIFPARYTYEYLLPEACKRLNPDVPYWPGSPYGGAMANTPLEGDIHQWHVWHLERFPYQHFPRLSGRFVSEFGMQTAPCLETIKDYFPKQSNLEKINDVHENPFINFRQKASGGQETIAQYCESNIVFGTSSLQKYIHSTQLVQSETVATAYRSWRRLWRGPGQEYCGGALVWQMNDCWPATSWALADWKLRPKMAFWAMKRENRPVTAGIQRIQRDDGTVTLELWAVNLTRESLTTSVLVRGWNVDDSAVVYTHKFPATVVLDANRSTELGTLDLDERTLQTSGMWHETVFAVDLTVQQDQQESMRSINFHEPLKEVPFQDPGANLEIAIVKENDAIHVRLTSPVALKGVLLEAIDGIDAVKWDDNGFDVLPGIVKSTQVIGLGLQDRCRLRASWLGGEWQGDSESARL